MGNTFAGIAQSGPLLLAIGVAAIAGLVSFLSPCVLPLVPGYLSYVTGLAGADLDSASVSGARRGRVLAGTLLFVAGFASVFVLANVLLASAGRALLRQQRLVEVVVGVLIIALGAAFAGLIPGLQREWRIHRLPAAGLLGAPVFGAVFALSWSPCLGPTLGVVLGLSTVGGSTGRAVILALAYCLGLGLPFVAFGLGFRRLLGVFRAIRRQSMWITRVGGVLLIIVGLALVTGGWVDFVNWLRATVGVGEVSV
ncbi:cytochrome c biogenesis protein CcdA [Planosporangium flavigriseum]|uniref:Cytochrome C biogenesis protein CcdA n=1 Tax=Planosporangium flavigriseum TaxID=373681 RepID=A0A8J3PKZ1_9ACTN|nr:cytochrome c biogenesis protein CcdA [Planosporangium flavigriseum]NJC64365.1 cytochrome c biogenesis protein CcdA [Planosporangium flavigriseum]GIG73891.1 cytochrome C biogenesis protein CcdA [Planosporangium flavigriseum]